MSILELPIDHPVAILDFETTGFSPANGAKVVEVSVVRVEGNGPPDLVLDTLVDPGGRISASRIHGITDDDVLGAPTFADLSGTIGKAVEGAVVASFNSSFDMQFWEAEFDELPDSYHIPTPPHLCLMYLRPLLGIGTRCSLDAACTAERIPGATHRSADDALASAYLWLAYRKYAERSGVRTFGDMAQRGNYRFTESFDYPVLSESAAPRPWRRPSPTALKPRFEDVAFARPGWPWPTAHETAQLGVNLSLVGDPVLVKFGMTAIGQRHYWQHLVDAATDGVITSAESAELLALQKRYDLARDDVRALHARIYSERLLELAKDDKVTDAEAASLRDFHHALSSLGWAPGD